MQLAHVNGTTKTGRKSRLPPRIAHPASGRVLPPPVQRAQTKCPCGGGCPRCSGGSSLPTKLQVGAPDDAYERQADQVADAVMRMPAAQIQRQIDTDEEEELVQTKAEADGASSIGPGLETQVASLRGGGAPLPASEQVFFEPRFGRSLDDVRIHTGPRADEAAKSINAQAFTQGRDIVFAQGKYVTGTSGDRRLLAHELVHVIQQSGRGAGSAITPGQQTMVPGQTAVQRRVVDTHVSCRTTGLHGGVPGGTLTGAQAIAILRAADNEAIRLGRRAENLLFLQRLTFGTALYLADATFDAALANRFGLSLANPADHPTIATIEREFKAVTDFLDSGAPRYTCRGSSGDCAGGTWAFALVPGNRLHMCNPFWNSPNVAHQGATLLHEAFHLWWSQVNDSGPPLHNAHCFEQFALDLAGVPVPANFAGSCVV